jgi:HEAT repeat protein
LSPNPVELTRRDLLGEIDRSSPEALRAGYQLALGRIVRRIRRGDLPARMLAARQVASLLAMVARAERREAKLPPALAKTVKKPVLLAMLRALLEDKSPVVRAETLTALGHMTIDRSILMLLGGLFDDPDPLVRMRAAELLGASKTPGRQTVLTHLSKDSDELVRRMASAFLPRQRPSP